MTVHYRDLRYIRLAVDDLAGAEGFAGDVLGLQASGRQDGMAWFRSDSRAYSLCLSDRADSAVALSVADRTMLDAVGARLQAGGVAVTELSDDDCAARWIKAGLTCTAPNGVPVEIVMRPLESGWRYHGPRDAGITGLQAVSLACTDIAANEDFWTGAVGLTVSDWAGDACYLRLGDRHHDIVLYPSDRDGIFAVDFAVEGINNVMQNFYHLQARQYPIVQGPGRRPASNAVFVVTRGPGGVLFGYGAEMAEGDAVTGRASRQFPAAPGSFCAWGSPTEQKEFLG